MRLMLENFIEEQQRPWGRFRVYLKGRRLDTDLVTKFLDEVYSFYGIEHSRHARIFFNDTLNYARENFTTIKIISINPNSRLSLQYHNNRSESWLPLDYPVYVEINSFGKTATLYKGDYARINKGQTHRIGNQSHLGANVLEVAVGEFSEDDIVRIQDDYARK